MNQLSNLWQLFLRPARSQYTAFDLGSLHLELGDYTYERTDFHVANAHSLQLACSIYLPLNHHPTTCVVYLHSFNGCRLEALQSLKCVSALGLAFVAFDFSGCGQSQGDYVTLGHKEQDDVFAVLDYIHRTYHFQIILWGRSMGATTALFYQQKYADRRVQGIIVDSPYRNLEKLSVSLTRQRVRVPKLIAKGMIALIRNQVESRAQFRFAEMALPESIKLTTPLLLLASKNDTIIPYKHSLKIYDSYMGECKALLTMDSDHSQNRSQFIIDQVLVWLQQLLTNTNNNNNDNNNNNNNNNKLLLEKQQFLKYRPVFSYSEKKTMPYDDLDFLKQSDYRPKKVSKGQSIKDRIIQPSFDLDALATSRTVELKSRPRVSYTPVKIQRKLDSVEVSPNKGRFNNSAIQLKETIKQELNQIGRITHRNQSDHFHTFY